MTAPTMTITIDAGESGLEASSLWHAVQATVDALERLDRAISQTRRANNKWIICEISMKSPLRLTLTGIKAFEDAKTVDPVKAFMSGYRQVEEGERPLYFDDAILGDITKIAGLINNGTRSISYAVPNEGEVLPTPKIVNTIAKIRQNTLKEYESLTELEGKLETINVHEKLEFFIYDRLTDNAIRCFFRPDHVEEVGRLLRQRVRVKGYVKFTANHEPKSVHVQSFKALPNIEKIPGIRDIHETGLSITGGQDSVEYIRGMRDAK